MPMSATLEIRELSNELSVRITEPRSIGPILMNLSAGGVIALIVLHPLSGPTRIIVGGVLAVIVGIIVISASQGADVRLHVTNLDFVSTGHSPSDYRPSTISRADVYSLAFREANGGGGEFPDLPQGLYVEQNAVPWNTATCVLPHASRVQIDEVIESTLRIFPDTCTRLQTKDEKPYLTSLNLGQPAPKN